MALAAQVSPGLPAARGASPSERRRLAARCARDFGRAHELGSYGRSMRW